MKYLVATAIVIGPLMLVGAVAAADQPIPPDGPIHWTAGTDSVTLRETYMQRTRAELQEWRTKLYGFSERAKAEGKKDDDAAEQGLNAAWTKTQVESRNLQTVSEDGWETAKASFEKASKELAEAWDKAQPQAK
jgi:hypothetical protein